MVRHPYSTNSEERKRVPFFLAVLSVLTSFALVEMFSAIHWEPSPYVDVSSTMFIYGVYYWLFKAFFWKWKWLRALGILSTPILEGRWLGQVQTAPNPAALAGQNLVARDVEVIIGQDWTDILIRLRSGDSHSRSTSASMTVSEDETILIYEYISEPNPDALPALQIHFGTARVTVADQQMEGDYYTGRGRLNVGTLKLRRQAKEGR